MLFYETDDEKPIIKRILSTLCMYIFVAIPILVFSLIAFLSIKTVDVTLDKNTTYNTLYNLMGASEFTAAFNKATVKVPGYVSLLCFWILLGWLLMVQYLGIGIIALPLDMILDFFNQPKPMTAV